MSTAAEAGNPPKAPVVGTPVSLTTCEQVLGRLAARPADRATVVAVCNVHSVMSARRDPLLGRALADADVATPDGMPLVWALRATAWPDQPRVSGTGLMAAALAYGVERAWGHYFYGATPATLDRLVAAVQRTAPGARVVGTHSPPFRPQTAAEVDADLAAISASGADLVWVGLGMPKQELWMHQVRDRLPGVGLLGVGAAFDMLAGTVRQAPQWMQRAGLEWAFRLVQEPRRLWRRYVWNNPAYLGLLAAQIVRTHRGRGTTTVIGSNVATRAAKALRWRIPLLVGRLRSAPYGSSPGGIPLPPRVFRKGGKHFEPDSDFVSSAIHDVDRLVEIAGLTQRSVLLDWGCGAGRLAVGIAERFGRIASYRGVDVQKHPIQWAAHAFAGRDGFEFVHVDLANARYNAGGQPTARIPGEDDSVDVLYGYSVFLHMRGDDVSAYLAEIRRVLARSGRAFVTAFVEEGVEQELENPPDSGALPWSGPLHCVRYERGFFDDKVAAAGLHVAGFVHGEETDGQSLYVLARA